jgi:hypothetical protein
MSKIKHYRFKCNYCGLELNRKRFSKYAKCSCGQKACLVLVYFSHSVQPTACRTIYSRALAIDPSQVEEAVRLHPDEVYKINEKEGIAMLEIRGAKHRDQMAKRHGMVLLD